MSEHEIYLLVAVLPPGQDGRQLVRALQQKQRREGWGMLGVASVRRDEQQRIFLREPDDISTPAGALFGGLIGAVVGFLAGPLGAVVIGSVTGAVIGGATAHRLDMGMPDERLREIGRCLEPGRTAVVALVKGSSEPEVNAYLQESGARLIREPVRPDFATQFTAVQQQLANGNGGGDGDKDQSG